MCFLYSVHENVYFFILRAFFPGSKDEPFSGQQMNFSFFTSWPSLRRNIALYAPPPPPLMIIVESLEELIIKVEKSVLGKPRGYNT